MMSSVKSEKIILGIILLAGVVSSYAEYYWMQADTARKNEAEARNQPIVDFAPKTVHLRVGGVDPVQIAGIIYPSGFSGDVVIPPSRAMEIIHPRGQFTIVLDAQCDTFEIITKYHGISTEQRAINGAVLYHTELDFRRRPEVGPEPISPVTTPELTQMD